jgi:hypothetical protein
MSYIRIFFRFKRNRSYIRLQKYKEDVYFELVSRGKIGKQNWKDR